MTFASYPQDKLGMTAPEDWTVEVISRVPAAGHTELLTFKVSYMGGAEETLENVPFEEGYQIAHLKLWLSNRDEEVILSEEKMEQKRSPIMTITVRRLNGNTFECVNGDIRLRVGLDVLGKVSVQDIETGETFEVHEVDGQIVILDDGSKDRANTIAVQAIDRARRS